MPLKGLKVREESEGSPKPKDKVQRIVWGVTGARDWKSEEHKTKGMRAEYSDGDGEWYEGQVVQTVCESNEKCVSIPKYKAL